MLNFLFLCVILLSIGLLYIVEYCLTIPIRDRAHRVALKDCQNTYTRFSVYTSSHVKGRETLAIFAAYFCAAIPMGTFGALAKNIQGIELIGFPVDIFNLLKIDCLFVILFTLFITAAFAACLLICSLIELTDKKSLHKLAPLCISSLTVFIIGSSVALNAEREFFPFELNASEYSNIHNTCELIILEAHIEKGSFACVTREHASVISLGSGVKINSLPVDTYIYAGSDIIHIEANPDKLAEEGITIDIAKQMLDELLENLNDLLVEDFQANLPVVRTQESIIAEEWHKTKRIP